MGEAARVVWASRSDCGNLGVLVLQGCRWHIRGFRALGMNRGGTSAECVAWFTEYGFEALLRVSICSLPVNGVFADAVSRRAISSAVPHLIKTWHGFSERRLNVAFVDYTRHAATQSMQATS